MGILGDRNTRSHRVSLRCIGVLRNVLQNGVWVDGTYRYRNSPAMASAFSVSAPAKDFGLL
jgi:hypothetical protein